LYTTVVAAFDFVAELSATTASVDIFTAKLDQLAGSQAGQGYLQKQC
jgi:hypothetical protein